jgi:class 3 adenylate cyclase
MKVREVLFSALKGDPGLVPKVTDALRKKIDEEEGAMSRLVEAAGALAPIIEEAVRRNPSRLNQLSLRSAHLLASLAVEDEQSNRRLAELAHHSVVGITFVDVAGFTTYTAEEGDAAARSLLAHLEPLVARSARLGKGECVKNLGDGFLLAFPSSSQAVRAATALRNRMIAEREKGRFPLALRVAVHAGEPLIEGDDLLGHDVNLSARLLDHCRPDEIVVSDPAKQMAEKRLRKTEFAARRKVKIKGLTTPVQIWTVAPVEKPSLLARTGLGLG